MIDVVFEVGISKLQTSFVQEPTPREEPTPRPDTKGASTSGMGLANRPSSIRVDTVSEDGSKPSTVGYDAAAI